MGIQIYLPKAEKVLQNNLGDCLAIQYEDLKTNSQRKFTRITIASQACSGYQKDIRHPVFTSSGRFRAKIKNKLPEDVHQIHNFFTDLFRVYQGYSISVYSYQMVGFAQR